MKQQWYKGCRITYVGDGRWEVFGRICESLEAAKLRVDNAYESLRKSIFR